ncbi:MAG: helix-turn-helix domain-containing protein, partial [Eubacteriales bacterium]|nr:helix-turn-helix domain-containing protein [Eubacteriales bacterium]
MAFDCGYHSVNYFNRCFYKKYNVTPTKYRKNCKTV